MAEPPLPSLNGDETTSRISGHLPTCPGPTPPPDPDDTGTTQCVVEWVLIVHPLTRVEGRTDVNNAARLVERYGDVVRWVGLWDKWLIWDGTRWKPDQALEIEAKAKCVAADLFAEIADVLKGSKK